MPSGRNIDVANHEADEQRDGYGDQREAAKAGHQQQRHIDRQQQQSPDHPVERKSGEAFAVIRERNRNRNSFRGDDITPLAPRFFEELRGALVGQGHGLASRPEREK
jgi:hypothetical protein